ncbi:MAG TPA: type VI secretion system tube protein Hcp [Nitrosopumilaceae archaeon]|nr:type VI secretion system tube protein Hcp [Nitrosopumilaceae archaeon]
MKLAIILVVVLGLIIASSSAFAETDSHKISGDPIYLNYAGISGNSNAGGCSGIQLDSFQWGAGTQTGTQSSGSGGGAGKVRFNEFTITKTTDKASPLFFNQLVSGKSGPAQITLCRKAGGEQQPYLQFTLGNTLISSYNISSGGDRPSESLTLNFQTLTFIWFEQSPNGTPTPISSVCFDVFTNNACSSNS